MRRVGEQWAKFGHWATSTDIAISSFVKVDERFAFTEKVARFCLLFAVRFFCSLFEQF